MKKSITKKIVAAVVGTMLFGALAATTAMADGQKVIKISYGLVKESGEGTGAAKFEELIEEKLGDKFDVDTAVDGVGEAMGIGHVDIHVARREGA